ncbi:alpha/beta hydrolase [Longispora sp. NPDC051575]|uniref:alpha/beta fold hydrolase n=1 Tax=Longispora sp. NPDC051575 TaxID=3154943 RepID=UPI00343276F4
MRAELPGRLTLPYSEQGDPAAVPVVLLPGVGDSHRVFEPLLAHLPPDIHAVALTPRGCGDATRPRDGYGTPDLAADVAMFLDVLGRDDAVLVGASSGGLVAQRFAADRPGRVRGLVLLGAPVTLRGNPAVEEFGAGFLTDPVEPAYVRRMWTSLFRDPVPDNVLDVLVEENLKVPARVWRALLEGLVADSSADDLARITAPVLALCGDRDPVLSLPDQRARVAALPRASLVVLPDAGHCFYVEEPARPARELTAFVRSL